MQRIRDLTIVCSYSVLQAIRETDATQLDEIILEGAYYLLLFLLMQLCFHEICLQFTWMLCSNKSLENVLGAMKLRCTLRSFFLPRCVQQK
jgi:hypothetical protein